MVMREKVLDKYSSLIYQDYFQVLHCRSRMQFANLFDKHKRPSIAINLVEKTSTKQTNIPGYVLLTDETTTDDKCAICFLPFVDSNGECKNLSIKLRACGQEAHLDCLLQWANQSDSCHLCREPLPLALVAATRYVRTTSCSLADERSQVLLLQQQQQRAGITKSRPQLGLRPPAAVLP